MNQEQVYGLEIQIALAKNIFLSPMVFEGGSERAPTSPVDTISFFDLDVVDHFFTGTDGPMADWNSIPLDPQ